MKIKRVMRWDKDNKVFRVFRLLWSKGRPGYPGGGYSAKLSFSLTPVLFNCHREGRDSLYWIILGIRIHYRRSYGGYIV